MIFGRPDYDARFQDPASEPVIYRLIGKLAALYEEGDGDGMLDALGEFIEPDGVARLAEMRAFAARAELPAGSSPIGVDEPVFLMRCKDRAAPNAARSWANLAFLEGADQAITDSAVRHAQAMKAWQDEHGSKLPDLPEEAEAEG